MPSANAERDAAGLCYAAMETNQTRDFFAVKRTLNSIGLFAMVIGLFWIAQGAGWIQWPASSFMIGSKNWVFYGACVALVGMFLIGFTRLRR